MSDDDRSYREGVVDEKLASHEAHLSRINGSLDKFANALSSVEQTIVRERAEDRIVVSSLVDQVHGFAIALPGIQKLVGDTASAAEIADAVSTALQKKDDDEERVADDKRSKWKRSRETIAWALGVVIAVTTIANFTSRLTGAPVKTPAKVQQR